MNACSKCPDTISATFLAGSGQLSHVYRTWPGTAGCATGDRPILPGAELANCLSFDSEIFDLAESPGTPMAGVLFATPATRDPGRGRGARAQPASHGDQPAALRRLCSPTSHPGHGPFDPLPASFAQYVQVILSHPIWVTADLSSRAARMTPRDINRFQAVLLLQCLGDNLYKAHSVVSLARGRTITWAIPICLILSAPRRARGWRERRRESAAWTTSPGAAFPGAG